MGFAAFSATRPLQNCARKETRATPVVRTSGARSPVNTASGTRIVRHQWLTRAPPGKVQQLPKRARDPEKPGLSLKGSGLVFVATKGGEIRGPSRRGAGLYAWDTRHLSRYEVRPRTGALRLRSAEVLPDGARLSYTFGRGIRIERHIHVDSSIKDEWSLANTGPRAAVLDVELVADADFRDLFEVRRRLRTTRGRKHPAAADGGRLRLTYTAVDGVASLVRRRDTGALLARLTETREARLEGLGRHLDAFRE
jgi:hypothetical protein